MPIVAPHIWKGLDKMTSKEFVAMGTLDYKKISKTWKNTMPNRALIKDLLTKTKGKLILPNTNDLFYDKAKKKPLQEEIDARLDKMSRKQREDYDSKLIVGKRFIEYTVDGSPTKTNC